MLKVLQFNVSSGYGGGERMMYNLALGLAASFDITIFTSQDYFYREFVNKGFKVVALESSPTSQIRQIRRFLRANHFDIIHCHGTRSAWVLRLALLTFFKRPKIVYTVHGFHLVHRMAPLRFLYLAIEAFLNWLYTDAVVCVSRHNAEDFTRRHLAPRGKIMFIRNGVSPESLASAPAQAPRHHLGVEPKFRVVSVGRLHEPKDFATLIKATAIALEKGVPIELEIVGDGPLRSELENTANALGVKNAVKFLGYRSDAGALIKGADVVAFSSNWEGLPVVPLEAGALGKLVLASNIPGVREVIKDGETGILFTPGAADELASYLELVYKNPEMRARFGRAAEVYIAEHFNEQYMVSAYRELYKKL